MKTLIFLIALFASTCCYNISEENGFDLEGTYNINNEYCFEPICPNSPLQSGP